MQVTADNSLAHALLAQPLQVTLYKQGVPSNSRRHPSKHTPSTAVTELVGSADVDLSALLYGRSVLLLHTTAIRLSYCHNFNHCS